MQRDVYICNCIPGTTAYNLSLNNPAEDKHHQDLPVTLQ